MGIRICTCLVISLCVAYSVGAQAPTSTSDQITELSRALTSPGPEGEKVAAAEAIATLGPDARSAVPALVAAISDPSMQVRISVCDALAAIGPEARSAVPALARALADRAEIVPARVTYLHQVGPSVRGSSASALASIGRDAAAATTALIDTLRSDDSLMRRRQYVEALSAIGPEAIPPLVRALRDPETRLRIGAAESLARMGDDLVGALPALVLELANNAEYQRPDTLRIIADDICDILTNLAERAIPELRKTLGDSKLPLEVRTRAAAILSRLRPEDAELAVPALTEALKDSRLREIAAEALGDLGTRARSAARALEAVATGFDSFQYVACASLAKIDPGNRAVREAFGRLEAALTHGTPRERFFAARDLGLFGARGVPLLLLAVRDTDPFVKGPAVYQLGKIGPAARAALPDLIDNMIFSADRFDPLQGEVARAIAKIGLNRSDAAATILVFLELIEKDFSGDIAILIGQIGDDLVPILSERVADEHKNTVVRGFIARALGRIGAGAAPAVPPLISFLDDTNTDALTRSTIIGAIGRIGPNARAAVPSLVRFLTSDFEVTATALAGIGPPAVDGLAGAARSTDRDLQVAAIRALGQLGRVAAPATSLMVEIAMKGDRSVRVHAIEALGAVGHDAILAEPSLVRCLVDPSQRIRAAACEALGTLAPLSTESVTALAKALRDDALAVRLQAAVALGQSAPSSDRIHSLLETAARAEAYETVRAAITRAQRSIQDRAKHRM
jgi:HEAT repeat protein